MNNQTPPDPNQQKPVSNPTLPIGTTNPSTATPPPASPNTTGQTTTVTPTEGNQVPTGTANTTPTPSPNIGMPYPAQLPQGIGGPGMGSNPGNFGQPMYPWLMPYGGQFTAPMSPFEQQALGGWSNFVGNGMGLNPAGNYLNSILTGSWLTPGTNPFLAQIQQGMQGMKDYQDQQAIARLQSSMASGGSAMSGAELGAQSDYLRNSNNQFNALMGQLMNQNYGMERGFMNQAPGELGSLASTLGQGYGELSQMGALPRQLQQNDLAAQYQDYLRQVGGMQGMFQYPDTLTNQLLYGGAYRYPQTQNQYGSSIASMLTSLLGGSGVDLSSLGSGIGNVLGGLFGGGDTGTNATAGYSYDGVPMGHDGPAGYWDTSWYNNALTGANQAAAAQAQKNLTGPNTTVPAILGLLLQLLGGKKGSSSSSKPGIGAGSGNAPNKSNMPGPQAPPGVGGNNVQGPEGQMLNNGGYTYDLQNMTATSPYGYTFPIGPGTDYTENSSFYNTNMNLPLIPFSNLGDQGPTNPWGIFPDQGQGNQPPGGDQGVTPNIPGGFGGDLNVPSDFGGGSYGGGGGDFSSEDF